MGSFVIVATRATTVNPIKAAADDINPVVDDRARCSKAAAQREEAHRGERGVLSSPRSNWSAATCSTMNRL
jgi:hypothetical protein